MTTKTPPTVNVPTIEDHEVVNAANHLAARAKTSFLAGAPAEAHALASHAAALVADIDEKGHQALSSLASMFKHFIPGPVQDPVPSKGPVPEPPVKPE